MRDGLQFPGHGGAIDRLDAEWPAVRLPEVGEVTLRYTRPFGGAARNVTVTLEAPGVAE